MIGRQREVGIRDRLDEPEIYIRAKKGKKPAKILQDLCKGIAKEFDGLTLP